jgi:multiple sugar transport system permease protein
MLNTVVAGLATVATTLLIGGPCAYSISRFVFPGKGAALAILLGLRAVPIVAFIVPLFVLMRRIGLTDKLLGLVVVYTALELPFVIRILKEYFAGIPRDLDDAALIDGCSRTQVFLRIVLPLMRPGLVVTGVIVFMAMWGAFLVPVILTRSEASITIQAVVAMLIGERDTFTDYGLINAVAVLSLLPPLVLTLIFQRMITSGIFRGAVR